MTLIVSNLPKTFLVLAVTALVLAHCDKSDDDVLPKGPFSYTDGREMVSWLKSRYERELMPSKKETQESGEKGDDMQCVISALPRSTTSIKRKHQVILRTQRELEQDKKECTTHQRRLLYKRQVMAGTLWCGNGNKAEKYSDLGYFSDVDKCCRAHDYCDRNVAGHETAYGVTNDTPYTWSDCRCDDDFRSCLHKVDSYMASITGKLFFDVFTFSKCLKFDESGDKAVPVDKGTYASRDEDSSWWGWLG